MAGAIAMQRKLETLGLASGPALGHCRPTFSYILILTYAIESIILTLHPAQDHWESHTG